MNPTIDRILCGVDVDDPIPGAIQFAHLLRRATGAALFVVGAVQVASTERSPQFVAELYAEVTAELDEELGDDPPEDHRSVDVGSLPDVVIDRVTAHHPDLVVVGAHEVEGSTSYGFGGIGHILGHHLDRPVATVANLGGPVRGGTFVVGVDGSEISRVALGWTRHLARRVGGRCCAVYSIDAVYDTFTTHGWFGEDEAAVRRTMAELDDVEFVERTDVDPAETLNAVANERDAAAVVVAARGRHALGGWLLGAVPDHLLHEPKRPVVVLPHAYGQQAVAG
jgi:nucleotide-binding universal stress UspA family protein